MFLPKTFILAGAMDVLGAVASLAALGSFTGLILYFLNRKLDVKQRLVSIHKTELEVEQIEYEIESRHVNQLKQWVKELNDIKNQHDVDIASKNATIEELNGRYTEIIKSVQDSKHSFNRLIRAVRRLFYYIEVAYWESDLEGNLEYVNNDWLRLFGVRERWDNIFQGLPISEQVRVKDEWNMIVNEGVERPIIFTFDGRMIKLIHTVVYTDTGDISKIIGISFVIS